MYSREIEADGRQEKYILIELNTEEEFTLIKKNCTPSRKESIRSNDGPAKCYF